MREYSLLKSVKKGKISHKVKIRFRKTLDKWIQTMKSLGLWIPPRYSTNQSMGSFDSPAHIDSNIQEQFVPYLESLGYKVYPNLDIRKAFIKNNKVYIDGVCLSDLDHFVWSGAIDRSFDSYHLEVLRLLEMNVTLSNSFSFFREATDKFSSLSLLHQHGVPVSEMYLVNIDNLDQLEPLFEESPFLLKPRRLSFGKGIIKLDNFDDLRDTCEYVQKSNYYLERFYPNDMNDWVGVTVINGEVLYGFRKNYKKISGWKVYDKFCTGGEVFEVEVPQAVRKASEQVYEVLGGNYFGLDFIKTENGYKIVDVNCFPGIYKDLIEEKRIDFVPLFLKHLSH